MNLFFHPDISNTTNEVFFNKEESRHIIKVLRKQEGDILDLTNGKGYFFKVQLKITNPKKCVATIIGAEKQEPLPYRLHMVVAPTKLNERFEWFLEKATEIGVSEITPIICEHSERKVIKEERYQKKIQSALKQSLNSYLPVLNSAVSFKEFLRSQKAINAKKFIAHCEETERQSLKDLLMPKEAIIILIGPEGDFSPNEIDLAKKAGYIPVSLGKNRLRTETAAIITCYSVAFVNE